MRAGGPDDGCTARVLAGTAGGRLGRWLAAGDHLLGGLRALVGPFPAIVVEVTGAQDVVAAAGAGLGDGPASAEAIAVRLRRSGRHITVSPGPVVRRRRDLAGRCRERGRDAVRVLRADPSLLPELQIGSWWAAGWRARLVRRLALATRLPTGVLAPPLTADIAFWSGVREAATAPEWRRLTASSYVVLCYHRLAGAAVPGQERMDVDPAALRRQLTCLRLLGWRTLAARELVRFHRAEGPPLPRRRYVITADDGFADAVTALSRHASRRPQLFAVTSAVGGRAEWLGDAPLAGWDELGHAQTVGATVGSHARRHVRLDRLDRASIATELRGSLDDLRSHLDPPVPVLAYPHGAHDARVRQVARDAGYRLAYTTRQGRNGAGTDPWCLRRVEPKIWDSTASFAWKVLTGESPPRAWERRLERRWRRHR